MSDTIFSTRAVGAALFSFAVIGATSYFGYAAIQGDTGLVELVRLEQQEASLRNDLAALSSERERMENLTRRLSERHLDLDLLDERTRAVLGYIRPDEIVIR